MGGQGSKNFQTKAKIEAAGSQVRRAFLPCQTPLLGLSGDRGSRRKLVTRGPHVTMCLIQPGFPPAVLTCPAEQRRVSALGRHHGDHPDVTDGMVVTTSCLRVLW